MIIGLDGGTWTILEPLMAKGYMPTLAGLFEQGHRAKLRTTLPPITPVAWPSMITGCNPGKHRVFGFGTYRDSNGEYIGLPEHRKNIAKPSLWRLISDRGLMSRVVNVPMTYPPEEINGSIVSGMFTPGPNAAYSWPSELKEELETAGIRPKFNTDAVRAVNAGRTSAIYTALQDNAESFLDDIDDLTRRQHDVAMHLLKKEWHFFMMVHVATDRIQHFLWDDILPIVDKPTGRQERLLRSYRLVDECLRQQIEAAGEGTTIMVVSDHGFGRCNGNLALGQWLARNGYTKLQPRTVSAWGKKLVRALGLRQVLRRILGASRSARVSSRAMPIKWDETKAFLDPTCSCKAIRINMRGKFVMGTVHSAEERKSLCNKLADELEALEVEGLSAPPIKEVFLREEVYSGPFAEDGPDILYEPNPKGLVTCVQGKPGEPFLKPTPHRTGEHLMDGICLIAGPGVRADGGMHEADITDVAPTVLALMGLPVPDYMDGRVLDEAFVEPPKVTIEAVEESEQGETSSGGPVFSETEQQEIEERLKNLGYME